METFRLYSLSSAEIHHTVVLVVAIMFYITYLILNYFITGYLTF